MMTKATCQGPSHTRVFFQKNNALSHKSPDIPTVVNGAALTLD